MLAAILRVVRSSDEALTTREICCAINNVSKDYCLNVDGRGGRCIWWYRRPKHETQRIRLAKPRCRVTPIAVMRYLNRMTKMGILKRWEGYLPDRLSRWGYDRYVLYYERDTQLRKRLSREIGRPLF